MAKGFTVKAKTPVKSKPKKEEWDYALARQLIKGKTVVFCLPGQRCKLYLFKVIRSTMF